MPGQCSLIWIAVTFVFLNKCAGLKELSSFLINAEVLEYDLGLVPITLFLFLLQTIPSYLFSLSAVSSLSEHENTLASLYLLP